jgi:hypothetical protein
MDWLSSNWIWIAVAIGGVLLMRRMGLGGCGIGGCGMGHLASPPERTDSDDRTSAPRRSP